MFYGLALLTHLVSQVNEARQAIAAIAVAKERRRIMADVHDLLGYGLSAITVKAEVAARAPERADTEFRDIARMARRALADLRAVPYEDPEVSLHVEGASAREILTAAGVDVRLDIDTGLLAGQADTLLATVVREAVTNVIRHSRARNATVQAVSTGTHVCLRVINDGVSHDTAGVQGDTRAARRGGNGIANLTARVAVAGGALTAGPTGDGGYELAVTLPVPHGSSSDDPVPAPA
nr:histidine kinase [Nocardiopsis sinuspersici]